MPTLIVGNSEVGIFKLTHHQKCLPQLYCTVHFYFSFHISMALWCKYLRISLFISTVGALVVITD